MKSAMAAAGLAGLLILTAVGMSDGGRALAQGDYPAEIGANPFRTADLIIQDWPEPSRLLAKAVMEKYGPPDEVADKGILWRDNGPWKRTVVYRSPPDGSPLSSGADVLQQAVGYRVPLAKFGELARFDPRVVADRTRDELSARSDSERLNFLALNLADEIIAGWKDAAEARRAYDGICSLERAGKSSSYAEGLRFTPD
jgi:hypothetical protein